MRVDVLLGALITEAVETCRNAKSDGTQVVLSVPDDWDQQKQNDFTKFLKQFLKWTFYELLNGLPPPGSDLIII